jgi:hypothetical protein
VPEFFITVIELLPSPQSMVYRSVSLSGSVVMTQYVYPLLVTPSLVPEGRLGTAGALLDVDAEVAAVALPDVDVEVAAVALPDVDAEVAVVGGEAVPYQLS